MAVLGMGTEAKNTSPSKNFDNRLVFDTGGAPTGGAATGSKGASQSYGGLFSVAGKKNTVNIVDTGLVSANQDVMNNAMQFLFATDQLRAERDKQSDALIGAQVGQVLQGAEFNQQKIAATTPGAQSNNFIYVALALAGFVAYKAFN